MSEKVAVGPMEHLRGIAETKTLCAFFSRKEQRAWKIKGGLLLKIIIVGAGKVGFTLAQLLSGEGHDITIIDKNENSIRHASDALDVICIKGSGASPEVLKAAGVQSADVLLAATSLDEVNMLCSLAAKQLGVKYTVARIRDLEYTKNVSSFQRDMNIDMVINPEYATAIEISQLLRFPHATNIDTFFRGRVELLGMTVQAGDFIVGKSLSELSGKLRNLPFLFCAVQRQHEVTIPNGDFIPQPGDRLHLIGTPVGIQQFFRLLGRNLPKVNSVFIVGGSRIAQYLSGMLEQMNMSVTIVDNQEERCNFLSEAFPKALVLHGDGTDPELLASEHFTSHDSFIALTGRDEDNLLISLYAKQQGIKKVVAKCNRDNYFSIVHSAGLESVVSPKLITVGRILQVVRSFKNKKGSVMVALHRFADIEVEASEFVVNHTVHHLGTPLKDLPLKPGILIAAVLHQNKVSIPSGDTVLHQGERVIVVSYDQIILNFNDIYLDNP